MLKNVVLYLRDMILLQKTAYLPCFSTVNLTCGLFLYEIVVFVFEYKKIVVSDCLFVVPFEISRSYRDVIIAVKG